MADLQVIFSRLLGMTNHGNGKFTGRCRYNTNDSSCLEITVEQPNRESDEKYYPWHGEFECKNNCSKSKILSNLNMNELDIFFHSDFFEYDPETYKCLFSDHEAKEFLKEEINFLYKVLQKPEAEFNKELAGCDLRYLSFAVFWLQREGRYCFPKK